MLLKIREQLLEIQQLRVARHLIRRWYVERTYATSGLRHDAFSDRLTIFGGKETRIEVLVQNRRKLTTLIRECAFVIGEIVWKGCGEKPACELEDRFST